jgi:hypothetical protein
MLDQVITTPIILKKKITTPIIGVSQSSLAEIEAIASTDNF